MDNSSNANEMLEAIEPVLIRCFVIGVFVLLFWFSTLWLAGDLAHSIHSKIVLISQQQFNAIHYAGMLMFKMAIFVLFLLPYIAIRLVIRKRGN